LIEGAVLYCGLCCVGHSNPYGSNEVTVRPTEPSDGVMDLDKNPKKNLTIIIKTNPTNLLHKNTIIYLF
jgi:hypothetical protein